MNIKPDDINLVLYHGGCPDGFCAAWAAYRRLGDKAVYQAVYHGDEPPDVTGEVVALLDFCYSPEEMQTLVEEADGVIVLDHHVSCMNEMKDFEGADLRFNMHHSGCVMSWMYFNPDKEVPDLLQMIEIRDLWTWDKLNKYPAAHVRKVLAAFDSYERSFQVLDFQMGFGKMGIPNPHEFIGDLAREGESIERFRQKMVHGHVRRAVRRELAGHQVMMVNCTSKELASDVGNKLCSEFGIIAAVWWYDQHDHMASVSLRSNDDINVDVSELAAKHGGGGHRNAAGFTTKLMSLLYPI